MITIVAVGKRQDTLFLPAIQEYEKRITQLSVKLSWVLLEHCPIPQKARDSESLQILGAIDAKDFVIVLDERGSSPTSEKLAAVIEQSLVSGRDVLVVIGGAYGLNEAVRERADLILAFGKTVFPHQLMRVMVLEQIYRSLTLIKHLPYHNA